jgi:hypothetical protein
MLPNGNYLHLCWWYFNKKTGTLPKCHISHISMAAWCVHRLPLGTSNIQACSKLNHSHIRKGPRFPLKKRWERGVGNSPYCYTFSRWTKRCAKKQGIFPTKPQNDEAPRWEMDKFPYWTFMVCWLTGWPPTCWCLLNLDQTWILSSFNLLLWIGMSTNRLTV